MKRSRGLLKRYSNININYYGKLSFGCLLSVKYIAMDVKNNINRIIEILDDNNV